MTNAELEKILENHKKWLRGEKDGAMADLRNANLRDADLRNANLYHADLSCADLSYADLSHADLSYANLSNAILWGVNLCDADLSNATLHNSDLNGATINGADLRGVDLDFSCLPLWCGSLNAHFDDRQLKQIAYHLVRAGLNSKNASEETKTELKKLVDFANGFHRIFGCGRIKVNE